MTFLKQEFMLGDRYSFGIKHPNNFSIYFFALCLFWIWFHFNEIRLKHAFVIFALNLLVYYYTETDVVTIAIPILLIFVFVMKSGLRKKFSSVLKYFVKYGVLVFSALSWTLGYMYREGNTLVEVLDIWLSGRIRHSAYAMQIYGVSLIGQNLQEAYEQTYWNAEWRISRLILDNTYIFLPINMGIIWLAVFVVAFYKLADIVDEKGLVVLSCWMIYSFVERTGINGYVMFPMFLIALLFQDKKVNKVDFMVKTESL